VIEFVQIINSRDVAMWVLEYIFSLSPLGTFRDSQKLHLSEEGVELHFLFHPRIEVLPVETRAPPALSIELSEE